MAKYFCKWDDVPLHCLKCGTWYGLSDGTCVFDSEKQAKIQLKEAAKKRAEEMDNGE